MAREKIITYLKVADILRAFKIAQAQISHLETQGTLRKRPWGKVTLGWVEDIVTWHECVRGKLPEEAQALVRSIKANEPT